MAIGKPTTGRPLAAEPVASRLKPKYFLSLFFVYFSLALIGMTMAVPPIYAAPIWPAAGAATLGLAFWGWRYWPAVWLAAFSSDLLHKTLLSNTELSPELVSVTATVSAGAVLQALFSAYFARKLLAAPAPLSGAHVVRLLVLTAPVSCLISATVGVSSMVWFANISIGAAGGNWLAWWTADSIGVLLALPLLLVIGKRKTRRWKQACPVIILPVLLASLAGSGILLVGNWEQAVHDKNLHHDSEILHEYLEEFLWRQQQSVVALADFIQASESLTEDAFTQFTRRTLSEGWIEALAWAPRVPSEQRLTLEARARAEGRYDYLWTINQAGEKVPAPDQINHYPFQLVRHPNRPSLALGYDLASDPPSRIAMQYAQTRNQPALAERESLYDPVDSKAADDWRLLVPVYQYGLDVRSTNPAQRAEALRGFAVGVIYLHEMTQWLTPEAERRGLHYQLVHYGHWQPSQTLIDTRPSALNATRPDWENHLESLGNGSIELNVWAMHPWQPGTSLLMVGYALLSILLMLLTCGLVISAFDQRQRISRQVLVRTAELKRAHRDISDLLNNLGVFVAELTADGHLVRANHTALKTFGLDLKALSAQPITESDWFKQHPEADQQQLTGILAQAMEGKEIRQDIEINAASGQRQVLDLTFIPVLDTRGTIQKFIATGVDIAKRKTLEQQLLNHEALLKRVMDGSQIGYWELHTKSNRLTIGGAWAGTIGRANESLMSAPGAFSSLIHPSDLQEVTELFQEHVEGINASFIAEFRILNAQQEWIWTRLRGNSVTRDSDGQVTRVAGIIANIHSHKLTQLALQQRNSELQAANQALELAKAEADRANRAKSDFLASMSHEIRTPLNGVIGMLEVLAQSELQPKQHEMVSLAHLSAYSLLDVINDILDFSKIEAGKLDISPTLMDVTNVVEQACELMDQPARAKGTELTLYTDPTLPPQVLGDELRIRQILLNLLSNAIKFSSIGGKGKVSVRALMERETRTRVFIELRVTDNGIGLDDEQQTRLFQPFTQADATISRRFGGSGLGLTISQHLIELMGGQIEVESTLGQGATFRVHLPLERVHESATQYLLPDKLDTLRCLLIGNSELAHDLFDYLLHAGVSVQQLSNLEALNSSQPDKQAATDLWIVECGDLHPDPDGLRRAMQRLGQGHSKLMTIERGCRRTPRMVSPDHLMIDGNILKRQTFLEAVALAAGILEAPSQTDVRSPPKVASTPPPQRTGKGRILVAEDNEVNQKVIRHQLEQLGFEAVIAENGQKALERLQSEPFDLLLTDVQMPVMDGYQLAQAARELSLGATLPIIALTANAQKGEAEHCLAAGMNDYLSKPVQVKALEACLSHWLNQKLADAADTDTAEAGIEASDAPPLFELDSLKQLVGDEPAILRELLEEFLAKGGIQCNTIEQAWEAQDLTTLAAQAHKIKSSALSVGALRFGQLCTRLEKAAGAGDMQQTEQLMRTFTGLKTTSFNKIQACLNELTR